MVAACGTEDGTQFLREFLLSESSDRPPLYWDAFLAGAALADRPYPDLLARAAQHPLAAVSYRAQLLLDLRDGDVAALRASRPPAIRGEPYVSTGEARGMNRSYDLAATSKGAFGDFSERMLSRTTGRRSTYEQAVLSACGLHGATQWSPRLPTLAAGWSAGMASAPLYHRYLAVRAMGDLQSIPPPELLDAIRDEPSVLVQHAAAVAYLRLADGAHTREVQQLLEETELAPAVRRVLQLATPQQRLAN
jgi:hypothetical protein